MSTVVGRRVAVGIGELVVLADPTALLVALGLGSCVAVIAHSREPLLGGLLHFMLPASVEQHDHSNAARYADTGIRELLRQLQAVGADLRHTEFKLAGGGRGSLPGGRAQCGGGPSGAARAGGAGARPGSRRNPWADRGVARRHGTGVD